MNTTLLKTKAKTEGRLQSYKEMKERFEQLLHTRGIGLTLIEFSTELNSNIQFLESQLLEIEEEETFNQNEI